MKPINDAICEITQNVWESILGQEIHPSAEDALMARVKGRRTLTGCVQLAGAWEGTVFLFCSATLAGELAAEMFPIAILRALATGLPVVCTNVGGIANMVREGTSGFLVSPEDPAALAHALLTLILDGDRRRSMGGASARLFHEHYHATAMAEKIEQVYRTVLATGTPKER